MHKTSLFSSGWKFRDGFPYEATEGSYLGQITVAHEGGYNWSVRHMDGPIRRGHDEVFEIAVEAAESALLNLIEAPAGR